MDEFEKWWAEENKDGSLDDQELLDRMLKLLARKAFKAGMSVRQEEER